MIYSMCVCVVTAGEFPRSRLTLRCSQLCFSSVRCDSPESPDGQCWQFAVARPELYIRPSSHPRAIPFYKAYFTPHHPLYCRNTELPGSYFKVQVLKAATRWETSQRVPHKRMNLCQLKSLQGEADEGGGGCVLVCVFIPMTTRMKTRTSLHSEPI